MPSLVPDDSGGVYVFWEDQNVYVTRGVRIHADGSLALGWPQGGRLLSTPGLIAGDMDAATDGSGGVFALWLEIRPPSNKASGFLHRLTPSGETSPGWPAGGVPIAQIQPFMRDPHLAPDGAGGAYCVWGDFRSAPPGASPDLNPDYWDIYAQHILGNGALAPGWPANGLPICLAPRLQQGPLIIADGFGGAIFEWQDFRDLYEAVYALRMNPDGSRAGGWPANGTQVVVTTTYSYPQGMATDGVGGAYFGIQNDTQERCYIQHLRGDGSVDPLFGPQGRPVVDVPGGQENISIDADGHGGVYAAWEDVRSGVGAGIWAQHFGADGPTATLAALVETHATPNSVHLVWQGVGLGKGTASAGPRRARGSLSPKSPPTDRGA
jgi:hypothetical protein